MDTTKGFIFDYSKCVGCHACMVACYVENSTKPPLSWRQVNHYNKEKLPLLGFINLSIACNHCAEAPCLKSCPTGAYSFDKDTKAVIHSPELCIGCNYCTWACPFDAPKYNPERGIIEKCHLCNHRLKENEIPACAINCPTGALSFGDVPVESVIYAEGLSKQPIYPRLSVKGSQVLHSVQIADIKTSGVNERDVEKYFQSDKYQSINPIHEIPLALFTFIGSLLSGWFWSTNISDSIDLGFWQFAALGFIGLLLSAFHLGKPFRAYLSIKNLKTSWLSREILLYGAFFSVGLIALGFESKIMVIVASVLAFFFLIAVEMVYSITKKKYNTIHSANTFSIALTFAALFSQNWTVLIALLALKALFFIVRYGLQNIVQQQYMSIISFFRLVLGFFVPFGYLLFSDMNFSWIFATSIILGEAIDRFMYYGDFELERPFYHVYHQK